MNNLYNINIFNIVGKKHMIDVICLKWKVIADKTHHINDSLKRQNYKQPKSPEDKMEEEDWLLKRHQREPLQELFGLKV